MALSTLKIPPSLKLKVSKAISKTQASVFDFGTISFHFKLPNGLALRSVAVVGGLPELRFESSPKVPTLLEEDVAVLFRLVMENKRPEFFYLTFPITHPLHESRVFKLYSPRWLQGTTVGELLADIDWNMKCLHVGTRSNEDKTVFRSWSETSNLKGLATRLDFPWDGKGLDSSIKLHCEYAKVQKSEDMLFFQEDPKMKIVDAMSSEYSKYITEHYSSVAYHDEPLFLKMQELIKLILAIEWLYKEKGVRVSEEWILKHTTTKDVETASKDDTSDDEEDNIVPPPEMIPNEPSDFIPPATDISVSTRESRMYKNLKEQRGVKLRYGYLEYGGAEVKMFTEDGSHYLTRKCLKCYMNKQNLFVSMKLRLYIPLLDMKALQNLTDDKESLATKTPVSLPVNDPPDQNRVNLKFKQTFRFQLPNSPRIFEDTMELRMTNDNNLDFLFATEDPNSPVSVRDAIIPNVSTWEELISKLTCPRPRVFQDPYTGLGRSTADGGVCTANFPVITSPLPSVVAGVAAVVTSLPALAIPFANRQKKEPETDWTDNFKKSETDLRVRGKSKIKKRSKEIMGRAKITPIKKDSKEGEDITGIFESKWPTHCCPKFIRLFSIENEKLNKSWKNYKTSLGDHRSSEEYYYGAALVCDFVSDEKICRNLNCEICNIACIGLSLKTCTKICKEECHGFSLFRNPSLCKPTSQNNSGHKAMLVCKVLPGRRHLQANDNNLTVLPPKYDSIIEGTDHSKITVANPHSVLPQYIIVYQ